MTYEDDLPKYYLPEEELRPMLEAIGNAIVERLGPHGLTEVVVSYDDEEGQTHVTAYFRAFPQTYKETVAIFHEFSEVSRRFFDDTVLIPHVATDDGYSHGTGSAHQLVLKAA